MEWRGVALRSAGRRTKGVGETGPKSQSRKAEVDKRFIKGNRPKCMIWLSHLP